MPNENLQLATGLATNDPRGQDLTSPCTALPSKGMEKEDRTCEFGGPLFWVKQPSINGEFHGKNGLLHGLIHLEMEI